LASGDALSVPLLRQIARGDPPQDDDVDLLFERRSDICHESGLVESVRRRDREATLALLKRAMSSFGDIKALQALASVDVSLFSHVDTDRHLNLRATFKQNRSAVLAERRQLTA
jgi:hypothetical protein